MTQTIFYQVADIDNPGAAEPFMVIRIDVTKRRDKGVEGVVQSLHWTRDEADMRSKELTEEGVPCGECGGSGFSGRGSGYGDVCGECGGLKYFPLMS
jgi:hypothetical protein